MKFKVGQLVVLRSSTIAVVIRLPPNSYTSLYTIRYNKDHFAAWEENLIGYKNEYRRFLFRYICKFNVSFRDKQLFACFAIIFFGLVLMFSSLMIRIIISLCGYN